jgi:hypothetical protein
MTGDELFHTLTPDCDDLSGSRMNEEVSGWSCTEISCEINPFLSKLKILRGTTPTNPIVNRQDGSARH